MTSQIRVDEITNRSGLGTVTIYDNGFEFTGVTTFTENVDIEGNLTIGGVLTYEDTTNIDSVGVITARAGINISGGNLQVGGTNVINSGRVLYNLEQIKLADTKELVLGSGNDFKIHHSGSHSFISQEGVGALKIKGDDIRFEDAGGTEALRIDDVGRLLIGRTTAMASSAERLTIDNAMAMFRRNSANAAALYIRNEDSTANTRQPYLIFADGSGNRGGFGIQNDQSSLWISGQNGIAFRTSGSAPSQQERLRISSTGQIGMGKAGSVTVNGNSPLTIQESDSNAETICLRATNSGGNGSQPGVVMKTAGGGHIGGIYCDVNSDYMRLSTSGNDRVIITNTGEMGVGAFTPSAGSGILQIAGGLRVAGSASASDTTSPYIYRTSGYDHLNIATSGTERLRITSDGRVGINEASPTARVDINHPNTEQGLLVRCRYGNINTAMVKFDADPDSNNGDGNVLHIHGGNSRTDSEILHIDSTGVGDIFDIRGDGLTRVYKQLQLEHSSNVAKIIFNEYGANDIKAQIEMDQINGSSGQLIFRTQQSGTLAQRLRISSGGTLYYNGEAQTVASGGGSAHKVLVTSAYEEWHFTWSGTSSRTATFTCPSYFHAEVIYTSHQTNGGSDIHRYVRGKWANNHTTHTWVQHENVGSTWAMTSFSINVAQNGGNSASGKLTISETYGSGSLSTRAVIMRIYYGASGLGWDIA